MGDYTCLGCGLWSWEPFLSLVEKDGITPDYRARNLWLGLYTTPEARRIAPGLWHGSMSLMAEAARMPGDDVIAGLDALLEREMVEFDRQNRVLRLTMLPDALDGCSGGNVIRGWFGRFKTVPQCHVRDAHVRLLRWIVDETNKDPSKKKGIQNREEAWAETFATIPPVAIRRRGVRRLSDNNDTSTSVQPGLFDAPSRASRPASAEQSSVSSDHRGTLPSMLSGGHEPHDPNHRKDLDQGTLPEGFENPLERDRIRIGRSGDPESEPPSSRPPDSPAVENANRPRPALALVPAFTPESLVAALAEGARTLVTQIIGPALRDALCATIRVLDDRGWGLDEARKTGAWLASAHGRSRLVTSGCPPNEVIARWAASPSDVVAAFTQALERETRAIDMAAEWAAIRGGVA